MASTEPNTSWAVVSLSSVSARATSTRRGPRIGWARYARASSSDEMAYVWAVGLRPKPAIWGNTNHIQWLDLRPRRTSDRAVADIVARQKEAGIDIVSDGEMSKTGFSTYINERFSGFDGRSEFQADDVADFPELAMRLFNTPAMAHLVFSNCVGPAELADRQ